MYRRTIVLLFLLVASPALAVGPGGLPAPGVGTCPSGQAVTSLIASAPPQCTSVSSVIGTLSPTHGGTGLSNPTAHDLLITEGASNMSLLNCALNTVLQGAGASADPTCSNTLTLTSVSASVNGTINVTSAPYNADPTGVSNSYTGIQNAIYAACGATPPSAPSNSGKPTVLFPCGTYLLSQPLRQTCGYIQLTGPGGNINNACVHFTHSYDGPAILIAAYGGTNLPLTTPLIGATGNALDTSGCQSGQNCTAWAGLGREINGISGKISGLTNFEADAVTSINQLPSVDGNSEVIVGSQRGEPDPGFNTFDIEYNPSSGPNNITAHLRTSTTTYSFVGPTASTATTYETTLQKNGSTCVLIVNGTSYGSQSCSGTITLDPREIVNVPNTGSNSNAWFPEQTNTDPPFGKIDYIWLSNIARSHSGLPIAKPTSDANTIALINWASASPDGFQIGYTGTSGVFYLPVIGSNGSPAGNTAANHLSYMDLCGGGGGLNDGLVAINSPASEFDHVQCNANFSGIALTNQDFFASVHDNAINNSEVGIEVGQDSGPAYLYNNQIFQSGVLCEMVGPSTNAESHSDECGFGSESYYMIGMIGGCLESHSFFMNQLGAAPKLLGDIYENSAFCPSTFIDANLETYAGAPYYIQNGTADPPTTFIAPFFNTFGANQSAAEIIDFASGSAPTKGNVVLIDPSFPAAISATSPTLANSTFGPYVTVTGGFGNTATSPNGSSVSQTFTLPGSSSGTTILAAPAAAGTPNTITFPSASGTPALTGADINGSNQVTVTHLASALPIAQGGTGQTTGATSMWSGISATITSSSTDYIAYGENPGVSVISGQANAQNLIPYAATLGNLSCKVTTACQAGGVAFTVEDNGSPTTLTCTCTNSTTPTCTDTTHFPTTSAGHLLDLKVVNSNAANATGVVSCGFTING